MTRLDAIKAREQAATKGPWRPGRSDLQSYDAAGHPFTNVYADTVIGPSKRRPRGPATVARVLHECGNDKADADFAAHARTDLPWLLAQVEALAGAAKALRDAYIARISHGHTHDYGFLPESCVHCQAERQTTVALTGVQTALAALEGPDA